MLAALTVLDILHVHVQLWPEKSNLMNKVALSPRAQSSVCSVKAA